MKNLKEYEKKLKALEKSLNDINEWIAETEKNLKMCKSPFIADFLKENLKDNLKTKDSIINEIKHLKGAVNDKIHD